MDRFLSIVEESSQQTEINEEKLEYFISKVEIWHSFGMLQQNFVPLSQEEKTTMLRKYYHDLESRKSAGRIFHLFFR